MNLLANQIHALSIIVHAMESVCTKLRYNCLHIHCGGNQCQETVITVLFIQQVLYIISD